MRAVDAGSHFGAAVESCLLICAVSPDGTCRECVTHLALHATEPSGSIGWRDGQLVANALAYDRWKHLGGPGAHRWRSGVKHDCSKVMELRQGPGGLRNGFDEPVDIEPDYVYPMLKSSDVANSRVAETTRRMLVPQQSIGQATDDIADRAPRTWRYLQRYGELLDRRRSSIYRGRPRFSVFGVGDYTFAPWKIAISGFYKRLRFVTVGPTRGRPTVLDDTVYFLPCRTEKETTVLTSLLNTATVGEFFSAFVFWDAKRPVTVELLSRLSIPALASSCGVDLPE